MNVIDYVWLMKLAEDNQKLIVDHTRVRPDIIEIFKKLAPESQQLQMEFITKNPPVGIDLEDISRRIRIGNQRYMQGEDTEGLVSHEEILYIVKMNRYVTDGYSAMNEPPPDDVVCIPVDAGGVSAEWQDCSEPDMDKVILYFHGGGYVSGSIKSHRCMTLPIGRVCNARILSVDYRLAPEHPFPAQLEDAVKVYKWLLENDIPSSNVVLMGFSAGGGISASLLLKLHELGIDIPAGAVLKSPGLSLTSNTESMRNNAPLDLTIGDAGLFMMGQAYFGNADPLNPLASPIYADLDSFPPILVQVGTNEMLYDHCKQFVEKARNAGIDATLQEFTDMVHTWHGLDLPESNDAFEKIGEFVRARFQS